MADFNGWKNSVLGRSLDIDGAAGAQCVDVPKSWAEALYPGVSWRQSVGYGDAKEVFANASTEYFDKITNDHSNANQVPQQGDIVVFAPAPESGYQSAYLNPYGHCAVVDSATPNGLVLIQQDGSTGQTVVQIKSRAWRYTRCIGWLHPRAIPSVPAPTPAAQSVYLPSSVYRWRIYDPNAVPTVGNEKNFIYPSQFPPGLTYDILAWLDSGKTVKIQTQMFGIVKIWVDNTDAVIK